MYENFYKISYFQKFGVLRICLKFFTEKLRVKIKKKILNVASIISRRFNARKANLTQVYGKEASMVSRTQKKRHNSDDEDEI